LDKGEIKTGTRMKWYRTTEKAYKVAAPSTTGISILVSTGNRNVDG
jgi:hypothetical protein